jgi:hypothetical protein
MNPRASVVLAAVLAALLLAAGLIGLGALLSSGLQRFKATERTVEVKGLAEREVPANLAIWVIQHVDADNEMAGLYGRLESRNAAIQAFLKSQGFDDVEITISPPAVTDRQARDYGDQNVKLRYSGRSSVTVYTPKVDAVRKALGALGELGKQGVAVSGDGPSVQYVFTGLNDIKPAMIEQAVKNARESAGKFAADTGSELGKLKRAFQGQFSIEDRDVSTPHIKRVRVVSTLEYYLQN